VIKEQIDVGIIVRIVTRCRAEQIKMLDAELLQLSFVFLELGYGKVAFHF
jgi:hypothetical protein